MGQRVLGRCVSGPSLSSGRLTAHRCAIHGLVYGEVSELADERDLGSRGVIRESSNLSFPIWPVVKLAEVAQW